MVGVTLLVVGFGGLVLAHPLRLGVAFAVILLVAQLAYCYRYSTALADLPWALGAAGLCFWVVTTGGVPWTAAVVLAAVVSAAVLVYRVLHASDRPLLEE